MEKQQFSVKGRARSFKYAFNGIRLLVIREQNMWIHISIAALVIAAGFLFGISAGEWIAIVSCIGGVFAAEAFNSAIESFADVLHPEHNEKIGQVKDLAAGAVLIAAIASVLIGVIIFLPKIMMLL